MKELGNDARIVGQEDRLGRGRAVSSEEAGEHPRQEEGPLLRQEPQEEADQTPSTQTSSTGAPADETSIIAGRKTRAAQTP